MTTTVPVETTTIPSTMRAWVLGEPDELTLVNKAVPQPGPAEVLVRIDAVAVCHTDIEIISRGLPARIHGGLPFRKNFTPGHEYMGTVVKLGRGVDEFKPGERVAVEIHAGCGRCARCRMGMYTSCLNYGMNYEGADKGHRANGFTTDGGFAQYAVNHVNTLVHVPVGMSDAEATLIVTAGTALYGVDALGGLVAGEGLVVTGPGLIGLMAVAVAKALGADPVILTGTREARLRLGMQLGADHAVNVRNENPVEAVARITGGKRVQYVLECAGNPEGLNDAMEMVNRGGRICLVCFPGEAGPRRCREAGPQQHLRIWNPRRRKECHPPRGCSDETEAFRREPHPHSYICIRGRPDRAPLLARAHRGRNQGRGKGRTPRRR